MQAIVNRCDDLDHAPGVSSKAFYDDDFQGVGGIRGYRDFGHRGGRARGHGWGCVVDVVTLTKGNPKKMSYV